MELRELARVLASLTDDEYRQVTTEARGEDNKEAVAETLRAYMKGNR